MTDDAAAVTAGAAHGGPLPQEKACQLSAFEDYYALGDARSLRKLCDRYRAARANGESVPTQQLLTLKSWSRKYDWQERVKQRTQDEAAELRAQNAKRVAKFRERVMVGVETDVSRYLQKLHDDKSEVLAEDAASLEKLTKLYFSLAGEPLADRVEHTGAGGGPIPVEHTHEQRIDFTQSPELAALAAAAIRAMGGGDTEPCGAGEEAAEDALDAG